MLSAGKVLLAHSASGRWNLPLSLTDQCLVMKCRVVSVSNNESFIHAVVVENSLDVHCGLGFANASLSS